MPPAPTPPGIVHVSRLVARSADEVFAYAADPAHLPAWAAGLARSELVDAGDGWWTASSPFGTVRVRFAAPNPLGVLDHVVRMPDGTEVLNPMRVLPHGDGAEVVFTVRRRPEQTEQQFDDDVAAVIADLETLRRICEDA